MPAENVAAVWRLFERWGEGPTDVPIDLVSPDVEFASPLTDLRGRPYRGYEGAREWLRDIGEQFESWVYELDSVEEAGDAVLALGRVRLRGRGSGVPLVQEGAWLIHFADDGRVIRLRAYLDQEEARRAAGV